MKLQFLLAGIVATDYTLRRPMLSLTGGLGEGAVTVPAGFTVAGEAFTAGASRAFTAIAMSSSVLILLRSDFRTGGTPTTDTATTHTQLWLPR
jgi:hypothetical protein